MVRNVEAKRVGAARARLERGLVRALGIWGIVAFSSASSAKLGFISALSIAFAPAAAVASDDVMIRVLIVEGRDQVEVWHAGQRTRLVATDSSRGPALQLDGRQLTQRWAVGDGRSTLRIGELEVRGSVEVLPTEGNELILINELPLETYLVGTLGREMYGSWGQSALQAQAVASRTYALHQKAARQNRLWHLKATTASQVYGGVAAESPRVQQAVETTAGQILTHRNAPILAVFHSSSGGRTAGSGEVWGRDRPYLQSIPVEDEWESPDTYWRSPVTGTTLGRALAAAGSEIGSIEEAEVVARSPSGRVARVRFLGQRGAVTWTGQQLRRALGESVLKSTLFELHRSDEGFVFAGSGSGHGVGMSQWAARAMAQRGDSYRDILGTFYPGTRLETMRSLLERSPRMAARVSVQ